MVQRMGGAGQRVSTPCAATPYLVFAAPDLRGGSRCSDPSLELDAIDAFAGSDRPLAWIDDDHAGCREWAQARPGPTLLVTAQPPTGITEAHVRLLLEWGAAPLG